MKKSVVWGFIVISFLGTLISCGADFGSIPLHPHNGSGWRDLEAGDSIELGSDSLSYDKEGGGRATLTGLRLMTQDEVGNHNFRGWVEDYEWIIDWIVRDDNKNGRIELPGEIYAYIFGPLPPAKVDMKADYYLEWEKHQGEPSKIAIISPKIVENDIIKKISYVYTLQN
jgi:hypothetical protein